MKKVFIVAAAAGVLILGLGAAGLVYAQSQTPEPTFPGFGPGMMGGHGAYGYGMMGGFRSGAPGVMHDYMVEALAEALGVSAEELQARLDAGETMWAIARDQGLADEQIGDLMLAARSAVLETMLADGVISQEQADWMLARMDRMHATGSGPGSCHGEGAPGGFGGGRGPRWGNDG